MKTIRHIFRLVRFIAGFALIGFAQHLLYQEGLPLIHFGFSDAFNTLFRIDVPNLDNVIAGWLLVMIGGLLAASALVLKSATFSKPSATDPTAAKTDDAPSEAGSETAAAS